MAPAASKNERRKSSSVCPAVPAPSWIIGPAALIFLSALPAAAQDRRTETATSASDWLDQILDWTVRSIEIFGIFTIVIGASVAVVVYLYRALRDGPSDAGFKRFRASLGRAILLGLEFLVAADIIRTVAVDPTLESGVVLAAIVLVRTFLSFALEVEISGKLPWRNAGN